MAFFLLITVSFVVSPTSALLSPSTTPSDGTFSLHMADAMSVNTANNRNIIEHSELNSSVEEGTLDVNSLDTLEVKKRLLDLLPRMTGAATEFREVETLVNTLEDRHKPVLTLDFLNLALAGEWDLLFSTSLSSRPRQTFRITGK